MAAKNGGHITKLRHCHAMYNLHGTYCCITQFWRYHIVSCRIVELVQLFFTSETLYASAVGLLWLTECLYYDWQTADEITMRVNNINDIVCTIKNYSLQFRHMAGPCVCLGVLSKRRNGSSWILAWRFPCTQCLFQASFSGGYPQTYNSPLPKLFALNLFSARMMNNKYITETLF